MNYRVDEIFRLVTSLVEKSTQTTEKLDSMDKKLDSVDNKLEILSGQFGDVVSKVIEHEKRIGTIEAAQDGPPQVH